MERLEGKRAIVTGAGAGIGRSIAVRFAGEGARVAVADVDEEAAKRVASEVGGEALARRTNVARADEVEGLVSDVVEAWGGLDVLVNNAGVGVGAPVDGIQTKRVDMQLDLNLRAVILFYRECADLLRADGGALVVNLASIAGKSGEAWLSVYSATKAAVIGWTQAMNKELVSEGVRSVALCPGFVDTPMTEFIREQVPPEEMIRPQDIAEAVRFLLRTSSRCVVPEIVFQRPGEAL